MIKFLKRTLLGFGLVFLCLVGAGLYVMWPFWFFNKTEIEVTRQEALPSEQASAFLAGVAMRDITTPIGIPKMGYAAWAKDADGFRTRLKARAFYMKPVTGEPLAVVQVDLPASSTVLHRKVAEMVAQQTDVNIHNLSIHATHTHSGPGQYFASDFYNSFGSNKPGFDPDVFNFLSKQIAAAVIEAYETRRKAKLAIGSTRIYGATKNRSMGAYVLNENITDKQQNDAAALRAVNPLITLVRLDAETESGEFKPMGAFSTFAIHGTGIPPFTQPYHGDVWAFFERDLENNIAARYAPPWRPVHGPFEANHGDNNPNYRDGLRGDSESRRIGKALAERAWQLFVSLDEEMTEQVSIVSAMREIDVLNLREQDQKFLCPRAMIGTAVVGAAQKDEVFPISYIPPFQRGWPDDGKNDCHVEKRWMLSKLQERGLAPDRYPHLLTINAFMINELVLVGLPFEITLEAGNRIANSVNEAFVKKPEYTVISSHTNGYFAYSTTREEYSAQWYEGGHTIYGPYTNQFLAVESTNLVKDMLNHPGYFDLPEKWLFSLASNRFFPSVEEVKGQRVELKAPEFVDATLKTEPYWQLQYLDVGPSTIELHKPLVAVEYSDDGKQFQPLVGALGELVDDQGYDIQIVLDELSDVGMARYFLRWYNPEIAASGRWFRFKLEPRLGQEVWYSSAFR